MALQASRGSVDLLQVREGNVHTDTTLMTAVAAVARQTTTTCTVFCRADGALRDRVSRPQRLNVRSHVRADANVSMCHTAAASRTQGGHRPHEFDASFCRQVPSAHALVDPASQARWWPAGALPPRRWWPAGAAPPLSAQLEHSQSDNTSIFRLPLPLAIPSTVFTVIHQCTQTTLDTTDASTCTPTPPVTRNTETQASPDRLPHCDQSTQTSTTYVTTVNPFPPRVSPSDATDEDALSSDNSSDDSQPSLQRVVEEDAERDPLFGVSIFDPAGVHGLVTAIDVDVHTGERLYFVEFVDGDVVHMLAGDVRVSMERQRQWSNPGKGRGKAGPKGRGLQRGRGPSRR